MNILSYDTTTERRETLSLFFFVAKMENTVKIHRTTQKKIFIKRSKKNVLKLHGR